MGCHKSNYIVLGEGIRTVKTIKVNGTNELALVDNEDYPVLSRLVWYLDTRTGQPVAHLWQDRTVALRMHRLLKPYKINFRLTYKDSNPLNNQKDNLVYKSPTELIQGAEKRQGSSSKYKGVTFSPERKGNQWLARINKNGKKHFLGYHPTQVEAALAYNVAAQELYGDDAYINDFSPTTK